MEPARDLLSARACASGRNLLLLALAGAPLSPAFAIDCAPGSVPVVVTTRDTRTNEVFVSEQCVYIGGFGGGSGGAGSGSGGSKYGDYSNSMSPTEGEGFQQGTGVTDAGQKEPKCGNPVILATGNKIEDEADFVSGGEMPLSLHRAYNHYWQGVGLFGKHWLSNYDYKLSFGSLNVDACYPRPGGGQCGLGTNTTIYAWRPDGRTIKFIKNSSDGIFYEAKPSPVAKIVKQTNGTLILYGDNNQVETYSSSGYISAITNQQSIGWVFSYTGGTYLSRVTHTSGRYIDFLWSAGALAEVRNPAGNVYSYSYNLNQFGIGLHRLTAASEPGARTTTYHYELSTDTGALTGKSFDGVRFSTFGYQSDGKATSTEHSGQEKYAFSYMPGLFDPGKLTTKVTNPSGKQATYIFQNGRLESITGSPSTYCPLTTVSLTEYDANGYPAMKSDPNGNNAAYSYAANGQLQQVIEAYGTPIARTLQYAWDAVENRVASETVVGVRQTTYGYTADNRVASISVKNLLAPTPSNNLNQTRTTTISYTKHPNGMLATETIDGPLPGTSDSVVKSYDSLGNLISVQNGLGHQTTYSNHNALGQPGRIVSANGATTDLVYDDTGRLREAKNLVGTTWHVTSYYYNRYNEVTAIRLPDGHWQVATFDAAGRKDGEYYPEGDGTYARTRYTYNNASKPTRIDTERVSGVTLAAPPPTTVPVVSAPSSSTNGSYTVSWTSTSGASTYRLEERLNSGTWTVIQSTSATSNAFSGKAAGSYNYRVAPCTPVACGGYSAVAAVSVTESIPAAPTLTSPAAYNYGGDYTVAWDSVSGANSYRLEESRNGGAWSEVYNGAGTAVSMSKGLSATFSYRVRACNSVGCSSYSATRTVEVEAERCPSCQIQSVPVDEEVSALEGEDGL